MKWNPAPVALTPATELALHVERVLARLRPQLRALLPGAEIEHIGATSIPGALTKGDLDVMVRVTTAEFPQAVETLRAHFAVKQPENWTRTFASFGDDAGHELPLGVQLVVRDSEDDAFVFLRDYLARRPELLAEYNRLKTAHAPDGAKAYWTAKDAFYARILAQRIR